MARRPLFIPPPVRERIAKHLRQAVKRAVLGFESSHEDEDTVTGELGAALRVKERRVKVIGAEIVGTWRWSVTYSKFRGRGPTPTEWLTGADGVFELKVGSGSDERTKSLLFQAKVGNRIDDKGFLQLAKLSNWREAAILVQYDEAAFTAHGLDDALRGARRGLLQEGRDLGEFLADTFVPCLTGDDELNYDPRQHILTWRAMNGEIVETQFSVRHRISIKVRPPHRRSHRTARRIPPNEIHQYRMNAEPEDILSLRGHYTERELKSAQRSAAKLFHPDTNTSEDQIIFEILKRRMQETNRAYSTLSRRR